MPSAAVAAIIEHPAQDITIIATASSGEDPMNDVRRYRPDVVTFDLPMPDMPGEQLMRRILASYTRRAFVAVTKDSPHPLAAIGAPAGRARDEPGADAGPATRREETEPNGREFSA